MSTVPPNWLGSIIQTQGAKARQAEEKQREMAADAERADERGFADRLQNVIDQDDRDGQVYSDAEGAGSQGRPFEGGGEEKPEEQPDHQGGAGLDLQA